MSGKGHFVFTQKLVEDVANLDRQNVIITKEHDRAHRGIIEVEAQLKRAYFFPNMQKQIRNYINTCEICNVHKYDRKPYNIKISPRPISNKPLDRIHMDIFIIEKCNFLSLIDSFSKHLQMIHISHKNLTQVQKALGKYFACFGIPRTIITDHETTFQSIQLRNFLDALGISLEYASCSESNGQVERTHSTIIEIFNTNKYKFKGMATKSITKLSVALYNHSVHSSTKFTPNELLFNQNNIQNPEEILADAQKLFLEAKTNIQKANKNQTKYNDERKNPPIVNENQNVFLKPNIRTKTQPRAIKTIAQNVNDKTFQNIRKVKRHKRKLKRLKKQ